MNYTSPVDFSLCLKRVYSRQVKSKFLEPNFLERNPVSLSAGCVLGVSYLTSLGLNFSFVNTRLVKIVSICHKVNTSSKVVNYT